MRGEGERVVRPSRSDRYRLSALAMSSYTQQGSVAPFANQVTPAPCPCAPSEWLQPSPRNDWLARAARVRVLPARSSGAQQRLVFRQQRPRLPFALPALTLQVAAAASLPLHSHMGWAQWYRLTARCPFPARTRWRSQTHLARRVQCRRDLPTLASSRCRGARSWSRSNWFRWSQLSKRWRSSPSSTCSSAPCAPAPSLHAACAKWRFRD